MTARRPLSDAERAEIARRYGATSVPTKITLCPPQTFVIDATESMSLRDPKERAMQARIYQRQQRFVRAAAKREGAALRNLYADLVTRMTARQIADFLNVSDSVVRHNCERFGLHPVPAERQPSERSRTCHETTPHRPDTTTPSTG